MNTNKKIIDGVTEAIRLIRSGEFTPTSLFSGTLNCDFRNGCAITVMTIADPLRYAAELHIPLMACYEGKDRLGHLWTNRFPCDKDRLLALLLNIIRNNGTFDPSDIRPIEPDAPAINTLDFKEPHCLADLRMVMDAV